MPGRYYMITRRCTQQQFLLHPDVETTNAFKYCLIVAAQKYFIDVLGPCALSNHHHTVIYDRLGHHPLFTEYFHRLLARCMNARLGRRENFWSSEQVNVVLLADVDAVVRKLAYAFLNPVEARLVEHPNDWPGVNGYRNVMNGKPLQATRPKWFFSEHDSALPEHVSMRLHIPAELEPERFRERLRARIKRRLAKLRDHRIRHKLSVLGAERIRAETHNQHPKRDGRYTKTNRRRIRPTIACRDAERRKALILERRSFVREYRKARVQWVYNKPTVFPEGTFWLYRYAHAPVPPLRFAPVLIH
ncbi:MAG TPA: hypothetical protein VFQ53_19685 [Kofleriaceae bacterium]|nr:hypothetical protein [Kofleriaceae bacterium]